jgi:hypothetical protein
MHSNAHCIPTLFTCFCTLDTGSAHYILTSCSCFRTLDRNEARGEVSSSELEGKGKNYEKTLFHLSDLLVSAQSFLRSRILSTLVSNPLVCVCVCVRVRVRARVCVCVRVRAPQSRCCVPCRTLAHTLNPPFPRFAAVVGEADSNTHPRRLQDLDTRGNGAHTSCGRHPRARTTRQAQGQSCPCFAQLCSSYSFPFVISLSAFNADVENRCTVLFLFALFTALIRFTPMCQVIFNL